ncbi:uncharacterized protein LOC111707219 [Eurytemora carolleeae]|uniref:uncharacterized protein LOC111707219 n=1 Tax=Eurytemora carolleeae TaxID=1294199 RepID=UPI000C76698C|nr:uncharacterized protein LOC111707219 [Eurytemora carolleeae]|eukprot:XP_023336043.1 uncharacterized protein LOC111707219 [Eurytemora affinis]
MGKSLVAIFVLGGVLCDPQVSYLGAPQYYSPQIAYAPTSSFAYAPRTPVAYAPSPLFAYTPGASPFSYFTPTALAHHRTALNVLEGNYPRFAQYTPYFPFQPSVLVSPGPVSFSSEVKAPAEKSVIDQAPFSDTIEVGLEDTKDTPAKGEYVTIKETLDSLPDIAFSKPALGFRGAPQPPPIPAGIVQSTQPKFSQILFKNDKLAQHYKFF